MGTPTSTKTGRHSGVSRGFLVFGIEATARIFPGFHIGSPRKPPVLSAGAMGWRPPANHLATAGTIS